MLRSPGFSQDCHCSVTGLSGPAGFPTHWRPRLAVLFCRPPEPVGPQPTWRLHSLAIHQRPPNPTPSVFPTVGNVARASFASSPIFIFKDDFGSKYLWQNTREHLPSLGPVFEVIFPAHMYLIVKSLQGHMEIWWLLVPHVGAHPPPPRVSQEPQQHSRGSTSGGF